MSGERAELELEAGSLEPGQSIRMTCPYCYGGQSKAKNTLSLTHREDGTLLYHCYRASCGAAGVLGRGAVLARTRPKSTPTLTDPVELEGALRELQGSGECWGLREVYLTGLGIRWHEAEGRFALPIFRPDFGLRGRQLRTAPGDKRQPKALTYLYEDGPSLAWNRTYGSGRDREETVVVVEDIPSALVLENVVVSVAWR